MKKDKRKKNRAKEQKAKFSVKTKDITQIEKLYAK